MSLFSYKTTENRTEVASPFSLTPFPILRSLKGNLDYLTVFQTAIEPYSKSF